MFLCLTTALMSNYYQYHPIILNYRNNFIDKINKKRESQIYDQGTALNGNETLYIVLFLLTLQISHNNKNNTL